MSKFTVDNSSFYLPASVVLTLSLDHTEDGLDPRSQLSVKMSFKQRHDLGMRPQLPEELCHRKRN